MTGVDWAGTEGQEGWEVELMAAWTGSGDAGEEAEAEERECRKATPHWLHLPRVAGSVHEHVRGHWRVRVHERERESESERERERGPGDREWILEGNPARRS